VAVDTAHGQLLLPPTSAGRRRRERLLVAASVVALVVALLPLVAVILFVARDGIAAINLDFLLQDPPGDLSATGGGVRNALLGTLEMTGVGVLLAVPTGLIVAAFAVEIGGPIAVASRFLIDVLAGIPSIVVGIFVYSLVVVAQGHFSGFAGSIALAIIMLPTVAIAGEEMLRVVPRALREGTAALGISRWRSMVSVFVPTVLSGIITGILLAVSRALGETAPLIFTALGNNFFTVDMTEPMQALPLLIYRNALNSAFDAARSRAMGAALLLVVLVLIFNLAGRWLAGRARPQGTRR
jgi:phosphate transport system permease protein